MMILWIPAGHLSESSYCFMFLEGGTLFWTDGGSYISMHNEAVGEQLVLFGSGHSLFSRSDKWQ